MNNIVKKWQRHDGKSSTDLAVEATARWTKILALVTILLGLGAIAGIWFSYRALVDARKSEALALSHFQADERAWIEMSIRSAGLQSDGKYLYQVTFANRGKTGAHKLTIGEITMIKDSQLIYDKRQIRGYQRFSTMGTPGAAGYDVSLSPGTTSAIGPHTISPVLAPGAEIPLSIAFTGVTPTRTSTGHLYSAFFVGRADYLDAFDSAHSLDFCLYVGEKGELQYCPSGNDEDELE
jgi:hypothetical protein